MNPFDLFQDPLTFSTHERNDLHYIGEALPAPSQIASTLSSGTPAFIGGSSVPAREDHVHALDVQDLIDAINALPSPPTINLDNYYTKTEIDAQLAAINTSINDLATILSTDYYTKTEVDALVGGGSGGGAGSYVWAYSEQIVDPPSALTSDRWYPPASITITGIWAAVNVAAGASNDYTISLLIDGVSVGFVTLVGSTNVITGALSQAVTTSSYVQVVVEKAGSFVGDAEDLTVGIVY